MEEMNFEEIRNQFAILKDQLNNQEIISDRLIRETMKIKHKDISDSKRTMYLCAVISLSFYPLNAMVHAWSNTFTIVTCLLILLCAAGAYYIHKPVEELNLMRDDFSSVARVMARFKKQYNDSMCYLAPVIIIPYFLWACYEFAWKGSPAGTITWQNVVLLLAGAAIGGLIGYYYHSKAVNAAQDIIDEIEAP